MKKYKVTAILALVIIIVALLTYISMPNLKRKDNEEEQPTITITTKENSDIDAPVNATTASKQFVTDFSTKYVVKKHFIYDNKVVEETSTIPLNFVGMDIENMRAYWNNYLEQPNTEDVSASLSSCIVEELNRERVIISKIYHSKAKEPAYFITIVDGFVAVYEEDRITLKEVTSVSAESLNFDSLELFYTGIEVIGEEGIVELLQNYTS